MYEHLSSDGMVSQSKHTHTDKFTSVSSTTTTRVFLSVRFVSFCDVPSNFIRKLTFYQMNDRENESSEKTREKTAEKILYRNEGSTIIDDKYHPTHLCASPDLQKLQHTRDSLQQATKVLEFSRPNQPDTFVIDNRLYAKQMKSKRPTDFVFRFVSHFDGNCCLHFGFSFTKLTFCPFGSSSASAGCYWHELRVLFSRSFLRNAKVNTLSFYEIRSFRSNGSHIAHTDCCIAKTTTR